MSARFAQTSVLFTCVVLAFIPACSSSTSPGDGATADAAAASTDTVTPGGDGGGGGGPSNDDAATPASPWVGNYGGEGTQVTAMPPGSSNTRSTTGSLSLALTEDAEGVALASFTFGGGFTVRGHAAGSVITLTPGQALEGSTGCTLTEGALTISGQSLGVQLRGQCDVGTPSGFNLSATLLRAP